MRWLALCALLLAGCVSPRPTISPIQPVNFHQFKSVYFSVHDSKTTEYSDNKTYGPETLKLLNFMLSDRLQKAGYQLADADSADLCIDIDVTAAKPGNASARFLVGFGAGRAVFLFDANFTSHGTLLAGFAGGRSYTGMEYGNSFADDGEISYQAVNRSIEQIETFMRYGGRFPAPRNN